jgi:predicted nucleic acid-binding protein
MVIFLDTSFLYALAVKDDDSHESAVARFERALDEDAELVLHNLVLVETVALLQRRRGLAAARDVVEKSSVFRTIIIDEQLHKEMLDLFVKSGTRHLSLVDMFSFALMRREGIKYALAFDEDFLKEGFRLYGNEA